MPPVDALPPRIERSLGLREGTVRVRVATDLTPAGTFGTEWIVVTADRLLVHADEPEARGPRLDLPLSEVRSPRVDSLVGGGALVVTAGGRVHEVARYTNALRPTMGRLCQYLGEVVRREERSAAAAQADPVPVFTPDPNERARCPRCGLALPDDTSTCPVCLDRRQVLWRLVRQLGPYRRDIAWIWGLMLCGLVAGLVPPYLTRFLMDGVLLPVDRTATIPQRTTLLGWLVLALFSFRLTQQALGVVMGRRLAVVGASLSRDLQQLIFSRIQFVSLRFFDRHPIGSMITRITQDTSSLETVLVDGAQHFVVNILMFAGIGAVLLTMNWRLTLLVLVPAPLMLLLSRQLWGRLAMLWERCWSQQSRMASAVSDALSGRRVVKVFAKEHDEIDRFRGFSDRLMEARAASEQTWATLFPLLCLVTGSGSLLAWYVGGRQVLGGDVTLGTLTAFISYLGMLYGPLQFVSRIADYLARALTSAQRVFEIVDAAPEASDDRKRRALPSMEGTIELRGVTFAYEPHRPVLENVSLVVRPGEMIGLVGKSGSGKTTLINLVCGLLEPQRGQILVDGLDVATIDRRDLGSQIGIVLQDTFLFNDTIARNIAYARPEASHERIIAAAKAANAHDFIVEKPEGYDTCVGEGGGKLSGGERQRIAIARAILHDPRLLILDEATASVDTDTERQIQQAVARLVEGRTTIAIAHRLSTLRNADRIVLLKDGRIAEVGTHAELLEKKGEFHRLVEAQKELTSVIAVGT